MMCYWYPEAQTLCRFIRLAMLNQVAGLRSWPQKEGWVPQGSGPSKVPDGLLAPHQRDLSKEIQKSLEPVFKAARSGEDAARSMMDDRCIRTRQPRFCCLLETVCRVGEG